MKKLSWLLAVVMLMSSIGIPALAEEKTFEKPYATNEVVVEASGEQAALEAHVKRVIEVDGLQFKDLNGDGKLDVYEDWRQDVDARVADLLSQMTVDEKIGSLYHASTGGTFTSLYPYNDEFLFSNEPTMEVDGTLYVPMYHSIVSDNVTTYLHNVNGTPIELLYENNTIQEIGESTRLGIPIVLSCDRSYNSFAGMVNMSNYAFGIADDTELLYDLVAQYAKEERALGFHVPFHTYGVEIGSWYGEDPESIARMTAVETRAYEENGVSACTKHFVARGGRAGYSAAKSDADLLDSWLVGWKAAVEAGTSWVMLNNGSLEGDCYVAYDKASMDVLRDTLGYDGCVVTDWPMWIGMPAAAGTTADGVELSGKTLPELYALMMNADVDQVGCFFMVDSEEISQEVLDAQYPGMQQPQWPSAMKEAIDTGLVSMETIDRHVSRVLKNKFALGLFEDPYGSVEEVMELVASDAYKAEYATTTLNTIEDVYAARAQSTNEMEIKLQAASTVLMKNDANLLPLAEGTRVFVTGTAAETAEKDKAAMAAFGTVVDTIEEADVAIIRALTLDDSAEVLIEDAQDAGKPVVFVAQGTVSSFPNGFMIENSDALLMTTYNCTPDHGSSMGDFFHYTLPSVLADMVFGVKEPTGKLLYSIARSDDDENLDWGELQYDYGMSMATRLYMAATVRANPLASIPTNLGDVYYEAGFGMRYGQTPALHVNTVEVDQVVGEVEVKMWDSVSMQAAAVNRAVVSGEPFPIYMIVENDGADGTGLVEVREGETLLASKQVSVKGGSFIIVTVNAAVEGVGEHTLDVNGNALTVTVVE